MIPKDLWTENVFPALDASDLASLRAVDKSLHLLASDDDTWLNKLTVLVLQFPSLRDLAQADGEAAIVFYARCRRLVADTVNLAREHVRPDEYPYLRLYGTVDAYTFTPFAPLRFPAPHGLIAELAALLKKNPESTDAPWEALQHFEDAPRGAHHAFIEIYKSIKKASGPAKPTDLRTLPDDLARLFRVCVQYVHPVR